MGKGQSRRVRDVGQGAGCLLLSGGQRGYPHDDVADASVHAPQPRSHERNLVRETPGTGRLPCESSTIQAVARAPYVRAHYFLELSELVHRGAANVHASAREGIENEAVQVAGQALRRDTHDLVQRPVKHRLTFMPMVHIGHSQALHNAIKHRVHEADEVHAWRRRGFSRRRDAQVH